MGLFNHIPIPSVYMLLFTYIGWSYGRDVYQTWMLWDILPWVMMNHEIRIPARALFFVLLTCKDERFYPYHPWDWDNYLHFHTIHHSLPFQAKSRQICHTRMVWVKKIPAETQISNIFAMEKSLIGGFLAKFEHGAIPGRCTIEVSGNVF